MRLSAVPQNLSERVAVACGIVPTPLLDTLVALLLAKTVIAGNSSGLFDALEPGLLAGREIAIRCQTDPVWSKYSKH